jgi:pyridoxine 5-phosphate synthase
MTKLSVNINKFATLRNARGGNNPNLLQVAQDVERFGAQGITVHPRPDERHIRYDDVYKLKKVITTEFNIEGNPKERSFVDLVLANKPTQVTLVPDALGQLTSNHGWDTITHQAYLKEVITELKQAGIRVSIFIDADEKMVEGAAQTGTDRIELYTENYAHQFYQNPDLAVAPYRKAAELATQLNLGINAGHDLDVHNLQFFAQQVPQLVEVSMGNTIQRYLHQLKK